MIVGENILSTLVKLYIHVELWENYIFFLSQYLYLIMNLKIDFFIISFKQSISRTFSKTRSKDFLSTQYSTQQITENWNGKLFGAYKQQNC